MSTLTRDRLGPAQPPLTRAGSRGTAPGRWDWPDPQEVAPPQVTPVDCAPATVPLAARWQCDPLPSWPLLDDAAPEDEGDPHFDDPRFDDLGAVPSAVYTPSSRASGSGPYASGAAPQHPDRRTATPQRTQGVAQTVAHFEQSSTGALGFRQDWASMTAIPDEPLQRADPSPSRAMYRLNRMWLTPAVRHFVRVGLPILLIAAFVGGWLANEGRRESLVAAVVSVRTAIENRPAFQVRSISVQSRSPEVAQGVEQLLDVRFPISSFNLDLAALRETAEALDAVNRASLQVRSGGVLEVVIEERMPAMIWRNGSGLDLIDAGGFRVARLGNRAARADLPLIAGTGAPDAIAEARQLWAAAGPLQPRMRGLLRVGERRWDVVLDRGQRLLLPATGAIGALERVLALDMAEGLLSREVQVVDLRNPTRPTLRLSPEAMDELTRIRRQSSGAQNR